LASSDLKGLLGYTVPSSADPHLRIIYAMRSIVYYAGAFPSLYDPPSKERKPHGRLIIPVHHRRVLRGFDSLRLFLRKGALTPSPAMSDLIVAVISIACLVYLVVAVLRPERF
jgi:K+-transporting ATPase KdpF subunit